MFATIEDIILSNDRRGIGALRAELPPHFCSHAARYILAHPGPALLATGFYIPQSDAPETDGPPGAVALGTALRALGRPVAYVTGAPLSGMLSGYLERLGDDSSVIEYPVTCDDDENCGIAGRILDEYDPALLISVERCSPSVSGSYLNMRGKDISDATPRVDYLFLSGIPSVGIGDGGNEVGMGNLAETIAADERLPDDPAAVCCDCLVIASVSNWGGYGIIAALSLEVGRNLLPSVAADRGCIRCLVDAGSVGGVTGLQEYLVDGFTLDKNAAVLRRLHAYVNHHLRNDAGGV